MGNVFKNVAKFLDNALSGGEVDVIVMDASAATADRPLSNQADVAAAAGGEADEADLADAAAEGGIAGEVLAETSDRSARTDNNGGATVGSVEETEDEKSEKEESEEAAANAGGDASGGANASAETALRQAQGGIAAVQQMLGEGQVAIDAAELESLRVDAGKWIENAAELENLRAWKVAGSKENVLVGAVDAADAVTAKVKKVSAQTQAAIDLQEKMEAQRNK